MRASRRTVLSGGLGILLAGVPSLAHAGLPTMSVTVDGQKVEVRLTATGVTGRTELVVHPDALEKLSISDFSLLLDGRPIEPDWTQSGGWAGGCNLVTTQSGSQLVLVVHGHLTGAAPSVVTGSLVTSNGSWDVTATAQAQAGVVVTQQADGSWPARRPCAWTTPLTAKGVVPHNPPGWLIDIDTYHDPQ